MLFPREVTYRYRFLPGNSALRLHCSFLRATLQWARIVDLTGGRRAQRGCPAKYVENPVASSRMKYDGPAPIQPIQSGHAGDSGCCCCRFGPPGDRRQSHHAPGCGPRSRSPYLPAGLALAFTPKTRPGTPGSACSANRSAAAGHRSYRLDAARHRGSSGNCHRCGNGKTLDVQELFLCKSPHRRQCCRAADPSVFGIGFAT